MKKDISSGDFRIKDVIFVLENFIVKGHCGGFGKTRKSDCFVYVLSGSCRYTFRDRTFTVTEGQVFYLSRNSDYEMQILTDIYKFIFIDFYFEGDPNEVRKNRVYKIKHKNVMKSLFKQTLYLWIARKSGWETECLSLVYHIYSKIIQSQSAIYTPESRVLKIKDAQCYIIENYNKDIRIAELSALSGITEAHFRRLFKEIYGMSPVKYINSLKVNQAKGLMENSNLSISQIAEQVGCSDVYYFSRMFKKHTGLSPLEFKKNIIQYVESAN